MSVFIGSVVLNVAENEGAAAFWSEVVGYVPTPRNPNFLAPRAWTPPSRSRADHSAGVHVHVDRCDRMDFDVWLEKGADSRC